MQINNPFQMNDWEIENFLKVVLAIQITVWGAMWLDAIGIQIPIIRQLVGFIYLTFIPGILILRILQLHKLGNIETLLYTVGLSIATLMFTGLLMNTIYPIFGISKPISIVPLIITISVVVLVLCVLCYMRDNDFSDPSFIDVGDVLSPPILFLCLVPFLSIFGTYLMNFYQNNIILLFLIIIIAIIVLLIAFDKFSPKNLYPLAVFIIAISLLYHRSLISMYIWGYDIQFEHYLCSLIKMNGIWDSTVCMLYNSMLSITMLAPIYSIVQNMEITWVFKIIYPVIFALVPLGLYRVFQKQTNDKIAFLSCFFFVSLFTFYGEMLALARQQIAELFLVLLILLMINKNMNKTKRSFLFIVFGISLAVSHYGISYIYMFCLISSWLILVSGENPAMQKLRNDFHSKFGRYKSEKLASNPKSLKIEYRTISSTFVLLFVVFTLTWYMYVSSSSPFNVIVHIGDHIASTIFTDFLNPEAAQGIGHILEGTVSPLHSVTKYLHLLSQFFIFVGVITLMLNRKEMKFEREYVAFSYINFAICFAGIAVPYFASSLNTTRLYQITLIFLAPFCVIGGITAFRMLSKVVRASWTNKSVRNAFKALSVFLAIFLFFNSGWVYEVTKDHPSSISLNNSIGGLRNNVQEVSGVKWLSEVKINKSCVYGDKVGWLLLNGVIGFDSARQCDGDTKIISVNSYIYLRSLNVKGEKIAITEKKYIKSYITLQNSTFFKEVLIHRNKIYTNGGAQVYH